MQKKTHTHIDSVVGTTVTTTKITSNKTSATTTTTKGTTEVASCSDTRPSAFVHANEQTTIHILCTSVSWTPYGRAVRTNKIREKIYKCNFYIANFDVSILFFTSCQYCKFYWCFVKILNHKKNTEWTWKNENILERNFC